MLTLAVSSQSHSLVLCVCGSEVVQACTRGVSQRGLDPHALV